MLKRKPQAAEPVQRIYAIGDVHGRYDLFRRLMHIIERDQAARPPMPTQILLLGDIIDRGPDAARMIRGCMTLTASTSRFMVLKGNHEEMMVKALKGDLTVFRHWLTFGGRETLISLGVDPVLAEGPATMDKLATAAATVGPEPVAWLEKLPLHYRYGDYLFVHAGVRPGVSLKRQHADDLLWIKDDFLESDVSHGPIVVHGHSISEEPVFRPNRIGIDTGAYRSGRLTALAIEGEDRWILNTAEAPPSNESDLLELSAGMQFPADSAQAAADQGTPA